MPAALRTTAPPARLAMRHGSGVCTGLDAEVLDAARRMDERAHTDARWAVEDAIRDGLCRRLDPDRVTGAW